jgi:hypothetical protein
LPKGSVQGAATLTIGDSIAVFHDGHKISGECGSDIRFHIGMVEARAFYILYLSWDGMLLHLTMWIGNLETSVYHRSLTCLRCGSSNRVRNSVRVGATWGVGSVLNKPAVPIVVWKMKTQLI